jgi:Rod binding domain-containing protein
MQVNPLQRHVVASNIPPEQLAGNKSLTQQQKIGEASRQFEAILLRQILSETQKTVIPSEFTDNSTAAGIYQDLVTNTLADSISKSGSFGLAKVFDQQLSPPSHTVSKTGVKHGVTKKNDSLSVKP